MALSFIWKKQLVWFITLLLVVVLGLTIGALLHDTFRGNDTDDIPGKAPGVKVAVPSLPYPTAKPFVNGPGKGVSVPGPSGNVPSSSGN